MKIVVIPATQKHYNVVKASIDRIKHKTNLKVIIISPDLNFYKNHFPKIEVYNDADFEDINKTQIEEILNRIDPIRVNWYYQQILKYSIVLKLKGYSDILIIDADTIVISNRIYNNSEAIYYNENEYNKEYFGFIKLLLPDINTFKYSTINNFMWFNQKVLSEMLDKVEIANGGLNWFKIILNNLNNYYPKINFSEYETYSNYLLSRQTMAFEKIKLFRRCDLLTSKLSIDEIIEKSGSLKLDVIAFEFEHRKQWWKMVVARLIVLYFKLI